jgi:hypothetical protein
MGSASKSANGAKTQASPAYDLKHILHLKLSI